MSEERLSTLTRHRMFCTKPAQGCIDARYPSGPSRAKDRAAASLSLSLMPSDSEKKMKTKKTKAGDVNINCGCTFQPGLLLAT